MECGKPHFLHLNLLEEILTIDNFVPNSPQQKKSQIEFIASFKVDSSNNLFLRPVYIRKVYIYYRETLKLENILNVSY